MEPGGSEVQDHTWLYESSNQLGIHETLSQKQKLNIKIYSDKSEDNIFLVRNTFNKRIL